MSEVGFFFYLLQFEIDGKCLNLKEKKFNFETCRTERKLLKKKKKTKKKKALFVVAQLKVYDDQNSFEKYLSTNNTRVNIFDLFMTQIMKIARQDF